MTRRAPLSNRAVLVTSALNCAGTFAHTCQTSGFLTLHAIRARVDVDVTRVSSTIRVQVGAYAMYVQAHTDRPDTRILTDFYVYEGEEVWVACDAPNEWLVHGSVSN